MATASSKPRGALLVGSIPLKTAEEAFQRMAALLPGHLRRLPDGEPGARWHWIGFQREIFLELAPSVIRTFTGNYGATDGSPRVATPEEQAKLAGMETGYDAAALDSYAIFCRLRDDGRIPAGTRFQVCLPTATAVVASHINALNQEIVEPLYEKSLIRAIRNIQDNIPPADLAVQIDLALEIGMLEGLAGIAFKPWFTPMEEGLLERIARIADCVAPDVQLGFHLCYGDARGKHFVDPKDTGKLVNLSNQLLAKYGSRISWIHMPVPKDRDDDAYFAPLDDLRLSKGTELYLGLLHANDEEGTRRRVAAAQKHVPEFGVATECGMGRITVDEMDSVCNIAASVAAPWG